MEFTNFHDPELSLLQSAIKHVVCHGNRDQPGLAADHPVMCSAVIELETLAGDTPVEPVAALPLPDLRDNCGPLPPGGLRRSLGCRTRPCLVLGT